MRGYFLCFSLATCCFTKSIQVFMTEVSEGTNGVNVDLSLKGIYFTQFYDLENKENHYFFLIDNLRLRERILIFCCPQWIKNVVLQMGIKSIAENKSKWTLFGKVQSFCSLYLLKSLRWLILLLTIGFLKTSKYLDVLNKLKGEIFSSK